MSYDQAQTPAMSAGTNGAFALVATPEMAEIDRDREITCALIQSATQILVEDEGEMNIETVNDAKAFLSAWFKRKLPGLEMPRGLS